MANISQIRIGENVYDLKDASARTTLESLADVAFSGNYGDLDGQPLWKGTQAEYEEQVDDIPVGTLIFITDDGGAVIEINYADITNKPQINGITLESNKTSAQLGLVSAETGKGLSTNDYTSAEKSKLAGIAAGAQENLIENITVNGVAQLINNKTVALTVMTNTVDNLVNYYTKSETYTQTEVDNLISAIPKFAIKVVDALPVTDISTTTVYLLRTSETETGNLYTEYIYAEVSTGTYQWEELGTQTIDLSDYVTTEDLNTTLAGYVTTTALATELAKYTDTTTLSGLLNNKVDKVTGKGLSTNDYTNDEKNKLAGVASGAEANVQSDWNETDNSSDAFIRNKPTLGTASAKDVPSSGNASTSQVVMGDDTRLSDARTPTSHNQASSTINAMTGYSKPSSTSAISTNDTLNGAIGKLERALDDKGTSNFSGAYSDLTGKPTLGTAAAKDVPVSGNASTTQVVMGNDTRLTDARNAADVSAWAKAATKPTYTASEVGLGNVVNTGDSATPVANGTTKFTTGGAYTELAKKVDKVDGKGLSTNDYTTAEKTKLSGIATGAQVNVLEKVSVNGTEQTITNKGVDIAVPEVLSDLDDAWVGTIAEYQAEQSEIPVDTVILITDDYGGGTPLNYATLTNLPQINNVTLTGNKTADDLGLATKAYVNQQIAEAITQVLATSF